MTIDERLDALTTNLELAHRDIVDLKETTRLLITLAQKDAENIRALTGVVADHQERIENLEDGR